MSRRTGDFSSLSIQGVVSMDPEVIFVALSVNDLQIMPGATKTERAMSVARRSQIAPVGLFSLACAVTKRIPGVRVKSYDFSLLDYTRLASAEEYREFVVARLSPLVDSPAPYFCLSLATTPSHVFCAFLSQCIKTMFPGSTIICGGNHASSTTEFVLADIPEVDYVICGEGEEALPALINALHRGEKAPAITGAHSRGKIRRHSDGSVEYAPFIENIDVDPEIYSRCFDMDNYIGIGANDTFLYQVPEDARSFSVLPLRGCPGRCTYCATGHAQGRRTRWRSLDNIRDEMLYLHEKHGITYFKILGSNFTQKAKTIELFTMFGELPIPGLTLDVHSVGVQYSDFEILDSFKAGKVIDINLAIEFGSRKMQEVTGKVIDMEKARALIRYAKTLGLKIKVAYMLGMLDETMEEMQQTIQCAREMDADWSQFSPVALYPGTPLYEDGVRRGYVTPSRKYFSSLLTGRRNFDTPEITANELNELAYRANLDINFVNNRLFADKRYHEAESVFKRLLRTLDFHIFAWDCLRRSYKLTGQDALERQTREHMRDLMRTNELSQGFATYFDMLDGDIRDFLME